MPALDWIFAAVLVLSMVLGAWRGLVFEVLSLLSWIGAFVLAQWLAQDTAHCLPIANDTMRYAAGFALVFVVAVMLGSLVAVVVKKLAVAVGLRPVDRALGALFGSIRGVLLLLLATVLVGQTPIKSSLAWQESAGAEVAVSVLKSLKPVLPGDLEKFLPA